MATSAAAFAAPGSASPRFSAAYALSRAPGSDGGRDATARGQPRASSVGRGARPSRSCLLRPVSKQTSAEAAPSSFPGAGPSTGDLRKRILATDGILFLKLCELEPITLGEVVHLKGFAARVDFEDPETVADAERTVGIVKQMAPDTLAWDGDDYSQDSYTKLIPTIYREVSAMLVMFVRDSAEERARVVKSWEPLHLPLACVLCPPELTFQELGGKALRATQGTKVVCFGGGEVVEEEVEHGVQDVCYYVVASRRRAKTAPGVLMLEESGGGGVSGGVSGGSSRCGSARWGSGFEHSALEPKLLQVPGAEAKTGSRIMSGYGQVPAPTALDRSSSAG